MRLEILVCIFLSDLSSAVTGEIHYVDSLDLILWECQLLNLKMEDLELLGMELISKSRNLFFNKFFYL